MKKTYIVGVREVHVRHFKVEAESEEEAKDLVWKDAPNVEDIDFFEFSHIMNPEAWSVEITS